MYFTVYFSLAGSPKTGLTPQITIWKVSDNSIVVAGQAMTEVPFSGFYKYLFAGAENGADYIALADADDPAMIGAEKWADCATTTQGTVDDIKIDTTAIEDKVDIIDTNLDTTLANTVSIEGKVDDIKVQTDLIDWDDIKFLKDTEGGKWHVVNNQMIFYDETNTVEIMRFDLFDENGLPTNVNVFRRERVIP